MAEKALKRLEEQLNCSICLDTYNNPKELPCHHIYCQKCLVDLVIQDQQGERSLTCPTCRQVTAIPASGVDGLQSAFHINHLLEIQTSFQKIERKSTVAVEGAVGDDLNPERKLKVNYCSVHQGKELELYCDTCEDMVCLKCALKGGDHHSHDCKELKEAFESYTMSSLQPIEKQLITIEKALVQLDAHCEEISRQRAATEANIHKTFGRIHEVLHVRETELISQLHQLTQLKLKGLAVQKDQIETMQAQLNSCRQFILGAGSQGLGDVLKMKTTISKQVKELTTSLNTDSLKLNTEADILFSASADTTASVCQNFGEVINITVDPSMCHATGKGLEVAVVGEKSTATLQTFNFMGCPCEKPVNSAICELLSEITGTKTRGNITKKRQKLSFYKVTYQPTIKGKHQLHITVKGQHIRGSPFSVTVTSPIQNLGTSGPISVIGDVNEPENLTINHNGEVVVTESGGHCVSVFSPNGKRVLSFGTEGSGEGQFQNPRGVAVDKEGNILVADSGNYRIQKFTDKGQFVVAVGTKGRGPLQFGDLHGIAFNTSNSKLYVVERYPNHCIQILNSDLTFYKIYGKKGKVEGLFDYPWGIACDSSGKVYVADTTNSRIQIFTAEMEYLFMIGGLYQFMGKSRGALSLPASVAVDSTGRVYVGDHEFIRICAFTSTGDLIKSFCKHWTNGLAVDDSGVLYVPIKSQNAIWLF